MQVFESLKKYFFVAFFFIMFRFLLKERRLTIGHPSTRQTIGHPSTRQTIGHPSARLVITNSKPFDMKSGPYITIPRYCWSSPGATRCFPNSHPPPPMALVQKILKKKYSLCALSLPQMS